VSGREVFTNKGLSARHSWNVKTRCQSTV